MPSIAETLRSAGVRPSKLRIAIFSYLYEHRTHPVAETIHKALVPDYPSLSLATVYNTLNVLAERHLIRTVSIDRAEQRFDADTSFHAHFKCRICGCISDIFFDPAAAVPQPGSEWTVENTSLDFTGICPDCASCGIH